MKLSPSTARDVRRLALDVILLDGEQDEAPSLGDMARRAKALIDGPLRETRKAKKPMRLERERRERTEEERGASFYDAAKREAAIRAGALFNFEGDVVRPPRCEWETFGYRCDVDACDPDHVIGGARRQECERLGAEGLMCLCRHHHDNKHANSPSRTYWLVMAAEHAARHGYRRLAALVEKARARHEAKHPPASRSSGDAAPATTGDRGHES